MAGNISKFLKSFYSDPARSSRFQVYIPTPSTVLAGSYDLLYRCEIAQLPGRNFSTMEQKTYGPVEKFPYWTNYNDIDLTFIVDDTMLIKNAFDEWMETINPSTGKDADGNSVRNFNFNYKSDYAVDIIIVQYDIQGKLSYQVRLRDAFPINVNQLDLDWSSDSFHKLTVTFAYTYWESISVDEPLFADPD
jgi:T4-like virus tail tube protein gp19